MSLDADLDLQLGTLNLSVTVDAQPGETVVLLGPNGAGKTTLLGALAGLLAIDRGNITLDGKSLDDPAHKIWVPPERRPIGVVFQDNLLFPHLSALENVAFGLRGHGARRSEARREARTWLERMGLAGHVNARPRQLSGGQAQRVALARALVRSPRLLLLDEPLAALDATTRLDIRRDLRGHLDTFAGPRILVTHDPIDAMILADRVIVLEHGETTQAGTLPELRAHPRSEYAANLIGVNLYRGTLNGDRITIDTGKTLAVVNDHNITGEVFATIRPESVALHPEQPTGSPRNTWVATVATIDQYGPRARVVLNGPISITAEITQEALVDLAIKPDARLWVSAKATEIEIDPF
ncbi:MAG TPA: ABC transporter ATP-binding protein [Acidimicrobiia bacterium]|nr:ABC transporter ATP-binding protein [Acidimicrobiia bacterium]